MGLRLEAINLNGFKSFVDSTSISLPGNLVGVVGPNGCGKSNIIDAVRWVMGETSAKQLRGESIVDVIFNGSVNRKPVGQASIELIFDNSSNKKIGGQYAGYNQISIKRSVGRDAQSTYYLNGSRCRRRDIKDIFLGTGVGARGYSIIEQGMISELIEAKPDQLRVYFEEASGISKYKERRRETENRIKATRENLNRINDLREELRLQIGRLQRQSRAAKRYKILKEEERTLHAQLLALRWMKLDEEARGYNTTINKQETLLQSHLAELQSIDTAIEKQRDFITTQGDKYREIQAKFYEIGSEIARLEQTIQHQKELKQQLALDLQQTEEAWQQVQQSLSEDQSKLQELNEALTELSNAATEAKSKADESTGLLGDVELQMHAWQTAWDDFNNNSAKATQIAQVEQTRIQHLESQQQSASVQLNKMSEEKQTVNIETLENELTNLERSVEQLHTNCEQITADLDKLNQKITAQKNINQENETKVAKSREELYKKRSRYSSLEMLQQAESGQNDESTINWLQHHNLDKNPRLVRNLKVDDGWEQTVEMVLGSYLQAVCVDSVDVVADVLSSLKHGIITLLDSKDNCEQPVEQNNKDLALLSSKLNADAPIGSLLHGVYIVDTLEDAFSIRHKLLPHESLVTKSGIWIGQNWLRIYRSNQNEPGIISREKELTKLQQEIAQDEIDLTEIETVLAEGNAQLDELKRQRENFYQDHNKYQKEYLDTKALLKIKQSKVEQKKQHYKRLVDEYNEKVQFIEDAKTSLAAAKEAWQKAMQETEKHANTREQLLEQRDECRRKLDFHRENAKKDQAALHEAELALQSAQMKISSLQQAIDRTQQQTSLLTDRRDKIQNDLSKDDTPEGEIKQKLEVLLQTRVDVEKALLDAKQELSAAEHQVHVLEQNRRAEDEKSQQVRTQLEDQRLRGKEFKVRQTTLQEQLAETDNDLQQLTAQMPDGATIELWQESIEQVTTKIARLGPINLAAIDEYTEAAERKSYLDSQHDDLEEALTVLQNAIRKIDRETRSKFKETFDQANKNFQEIFPKVFGGGKAYLEMTGDDLLDTGVSVMARPPGKHVSNIHLLSGGEKALTAISLTFALFQLNPSPFCMLDEVDAPLDDANVGRFCELVKEMSKQVQFIFISHNTGTIEMADQLMGVTMHEPGVSRIVSVDIDAAVAMAEA